MLIARDRTESVRFPFSNYDYTHAGLDSFDDLSPAFLDFILPFHEEFTPRQQALAAERARVLAEAHRGNLPSHLEPSMATTTGWRIRLPEWCRDQRNQMTGPADDTEVVVRMLNSGAPGVVLDLEDSMANFLPNRRLGISNILRALRGSLTYFDVKHKREVPISPSNAVIWLRPRGLHMSQGGVLPNSNEVMSASLFDTAAIFFGTNPRELKHPLSFYIPKSESAEEALWWRDLFRALAGARRLPEDYIKCMALVESHPLAYQMEEFAFNLRDHILGLNLGRRDYMASLIHFNLHDPNWVLPDRNTIPHDVPFIRNLRDLLVEICHRHGMLAIGGMTALYPSRIDAELNERAMKVLAEDKKNEADRLMDGAWTGNLDQNGIAVDQFPYPNLLQAGVPGAERYPDLRPVPEGVGKRTVAGTRAAVRTIIRYRNGVLNGKGASLLDGYMEDLATDRIYRLMIAQRIRHRDRIKIVDEAGNEFVHTPENIGRLFDEELDRILKEMPPEADSGEIETNRQARQISEEMIVRNQFNPR
jgi:malate synthase